MPLSPGDKLGAYKILAPLGAGGMGEVYRARDHKLNRDVAIKVLPSNVAKEAARLQRFEREAQVLASLNHPNIAAIYGIEQGAIVMELVEGENLNGPVPLDTAIAYARQIIAALEAAHERGIIHRDLKPANIKVTPEGTVKLLDFGLAKAAIPKAADPEHSPTITLSATRAGVILGTAVYMAPEQARGKPVDKRADIWAFGCVLYEMLCGKRAFTGESTAEILAAVLKSEPDWKALSGDTPPNLRRLLRRCLIKDPALRLHDIADARLELLEESATPAAASPFRMVFSWWTAMAACAALAFAAGSWWGDTRTPLQNHWAGERMGGSEVALGPRISPDGQLLAFQAMVNGITQVAVLKPASGNWTILTHDEKNGFVEDICWSRDGTRLYYGRFGNPSGSIYSVPVLGGDERLLVENAGFPQVAADGSILFGRLIAEGGYQLHRYWPETGRVQPLKVLLFRSGSPAFRMAPSGDRMVVLGTPLDRSGERVHLYALDLRTEKTTRLAPDETIEPHYPFPLAVSGDGRSALFASNSADLQSVVSVPMDGSPGIKTHLFQTNVTGYLDAGKDGSIYADVWERPGQVLRMNRSAGVIEQMGTAQIDIGAPEAVPLQDGRVVFATRTAGRERLLVAASGRDPFPLVETQEETTTPATPVGTGEVAFLMGAPPNQLIAVATIAGGRIVRRLESTKGRSVQSMTTLPDGRAIFFTAKGSVWSIPAGGGEPQRIGAGDSVAADPSRAELIVRLDEKEAVRLVRMSQSGSDVRPILVAGHDIRMAPGDPINPRAVHPDGHILISVSTGMWTFPAGILDPGSGRIQLLPLGYPADMSAPGWSPDGMVITLAAPIRSSVWRFRPGRS
jgi:eukaryotic-like serine/threonine-protein kinase